MHYHGGHVQDKSNVALIATLLKPYIVFIVSKSFNSGGKKLIITDLYHSP